MARYRLLFVLMAFCVVAPSMAQAAPPPQTGFESPESAHWDAGTGAWYVSNTDGGYVSKLDADGAIAEQRWVEDLHGPYGVAAHRGLLYVSDTDRVVAIDLKSGAIRREFAFPDASLLNDVAVDGNGDVYVSDTCLGDVHRIRKGKAAPEVFVTLANEGPNGLGFDGRSLIVAGLGALPGVCGDPSSVGGRVLSVDLKSREITPLTDPLGALDGLEVDGDRYLVTDFASGRLLAVDAVTGASTVVTEVAPSAADIGFDPATGVVAVPASLADALFFYDV